MIGIYILAVAMGSSDLLGVNGLMDKYELLIKVYINMCLIAKLTSAYLNMIMDFGGAVNLYLNWWTGLYVQQLQLRNVSL